MDQVRNTSCLLEEKWAAVNGVMAEEAHVFLDLTYFRNEETASLATLLGRFYINWTQTRWHDPSSRCGSELRTHTRQVFEKITPATMNSDLGQTVMSCRKPYQLHSGAENLITSHYLYYNTLEFHAEDLTWLCWFKSNRWTEFSQSTNAKKLNTGFIFQEGKENWNLRFIFFFTHQKLGVSVWSFSPHLHASSGVNDLFVVRLFAV